MRAVTPPPPARPLCGRWIAAGLASALLVSVPVAAQQREYTKRELELLPPYCKYTQLFRDSVPGGNDRAEIERWTRVIGPEFIHMHHYCWGLIATNTATYFARDTRERTSHLTHSVREFNYVINNSRPNFVLLPEILTKKGENLMRIGQAPMAVAALHRAIALKADYWPPYVALADYFKSIGDVPQAREWLEKGLSAAPDSKALRSRLAELGGGKGSGVTAPQPPKRPPEQPAQPQPESAASRESPADAGSESPAK